MDRGAWQAMVHGVIKSQTRLKRLDMHARSLLCQPLYFLCIHLKIDNRVCGMGEWHRGRTAGATVPSGQLFPMAQIAPQLWCKIYASAAAWETWVMPGRQPLEQVP